MPEVSKKESVCDTPGELSNPVPETARSGIPTENTNDCDAPENLSTPVPEESRPKTAEIVASTKSTKDCSLPKDDGCVASPKSSEEVTKNVEPSRDSETRRTMRGPVDTNATNNPGSVRNSSGESSGGANEPTEAPTLSSLGIIARGVPRVSANGKSSNSHENTRIIQPAGSSGKFIYCSKVLSIKVLRSFFLRWAKCEFYSHWFKFRCFLNIDIGQERVPSITQAARRDLAWERCFEFSIFFKFISLSISNYIHHYDSTLLTIQTLTILTVYLYEKKKKHTAKFL